MNEYAIKVSGVKKRYKLGQIGGGTLTADLQSWWAKVRGKEDPNTKIGQDQRSNGDTFMALNGVDLTVKKGEALGIIGGNGAGKSTLLKLLSRVTAPTEGVIDIYGRITSMLEVGTGFNGEMTGRENVYLNGAILGMTKAEVDAKMEDIIEFSEVREFIDTPVKRYSSGMYVKLAFSVAAHLDSEIMIMDEVLAVGDMAFQKKCLEKMRDAAKKEGRTVLYVSHNMNTIRQLCDRCVVLDKGKVIFEGDVEKAIEVYFGKKSELSIYNDCRNTVREPIGDGKIHINSVELLDVEFPTITNNDPLKIKVQYSSEENFNNLAFRLILFTKGRTPIGMTTTKPIINAKVGENVSVFKLNLPFLAQDEYNCRIVFYETSGQEFSIVHDVVDNAFSFTKQKNVYDYGITMQWNSAVWGYNEYPDIDVVIEE